MPVEELQHFFADLKLDEHDRQTGSRILTEITSRLEYLNEVGLGYLTLDRLSSTLSGGESQRINLATSLGSKLGRLTLYSRRTQYRTTSSRYPQTDRSPQKVAQFRQYCHCRRARGGDYSGSRHHH